MPLIDWRPEFSVNIEVIDEQHKKLIDNINILHDAMKEGKAKDILSKIFDGLVEYAVNHFATEEGFFYIYDYPQAEEHKKEHDNFKAKVRDMKAKFEGGKVGLPIELSDFLRDWLQKHVLDMDRKYGPFLNDKGVF
ncbi:MAG TPA: bacteriohemerythrin [Candidatus Omnitrophota bacterium]|nr:bacteriohemerythrin [Candidatus Omnitrophota bacterium]